MFCPKCGYEYRHGFTVCSDCNVELVDSLPPEPPQEYVEYEEIYSTFNPADIAFIKSLFDSNGITYHFHGEHFSYIKPLALPVRLMVSKDHAETARELLKESNLSFLGINLHNEEK